MNESFALFAHDSPILRRGQAQPWLVMYVTVWKRDMFIRGRCRSHQIEVRKGSFSVNCERSPV